MTIYAISDLHLSFNKPVDLFQINHDEDVEKPMDVFGWKRHYNKVRDHWLGSSKTRGYGVDPWRYQLGPQVGAGSA